MCDCHTSYRIYCCLTLRITFDEYFLAFGPTNLKSLVIGRKGWWSTVRGTTYLMTTRWIYMNYKYACRWKRSCSQMYLSIKGERNYLFPMETHFYIHSRWFF